MNLKILFIFLIYYSVLSLFYITGASSLEGVSSNINLNDTDVSTGELDTGGLFSTGVSFKRFVGFVGFGLGLGGDTPLWFKIIFATWQTIVSIMALGFIISSIWNG